MSKRKRKTLKIGKLEIGVYNLNDAEVEGNMFQAPVMTTSKFVYFTKESLGLVLRLTFVNPSYITPDLCLESPKGLRGSFQMVLTDLKPYKDVVIKDFKLSIRKDEYFHSVYIYIKREDLEWEDDRNFELMFIDTKTNGLMGDYEFRIKEKDMILPYDDERGSFMLSSDSLPTEETMN